MSELKSIHDHVKDGSPVETQDEHEVKIYAALDNGDIHGAVKIAGRWLIGSWSKEGHAHLNALADTKLNFDLKLMRPRHWALVRRKKNGEVSVVLCYKQLLDRDPPKLETCASVTEDDDVGWIDISSKVNEAKLVPALSIFNKVI